MAGKESLKLVRLDNIRNILVNANFKAVHFTVGRLKEAS